MESRPQSSFIPKKPVVEGGIDHSRSIALLPLLATIVFVITLLVALGFFGYNYYVSKNIADMDAKLKEMQKNFRPELIADLSRLDKRIENAKDILDNHVSTSEVFRALEALTVKTVRFTSFQFSGMTGMQTDSFELSLEGVGRNYNSVAAQSDIFLKTDAFISPLFYDLALDESGNVLFKVKTLVDSSSVLYKTGIISQEAASSPTPTPTPGATSTPNTSVGGSATSSRSGSGNSGSN